MSVKSFIRNLFRKESRIDKLARYKKEIVLQRDKLERDMRDRNSKRDTKITLLENAGLTDYENTQKKVVELNRRLDKIIRDINSEQIYVNEVADSEKEEHIEGLKQAMENKKPKGLYTGGKENGRD